MLLIDDLKVTLDADAGMVKALDGLRLTLQRGETFALVGESGCGKSMTALALMRLLPENGRITQGRYELEGEDVLALPESRMRGIRGGRIGMIFQEPATSLNPVMKVGDQIDKRLLALHLPGWPVGFRHGDLAQDSTRRRGEHVHTVAEIDGLLDRMRHEKDRRFGFSPQLVQQLLHVEARRRIERAKRLVHQDDARSQNEGARDRYALAHAAGQLARILVRVPLDVQPDFLDPRAGLVAALFRAGAAALEAEGDVVFNRAIVERRVVLKHHAAICARPGDGRLRDMH